MLHFLLRLTPAFILYSVAQAASLAPAVLGVPPSDNDIVIAQAKVSGESAQPPTEFKNFGSGGLKEAPSILDSAPDQTGSITTLPKDLIDPNNPGIMIYEGLSQPGPTTGIPAPPLIELNEQPGTSGAIK
jgi:hypothetical protein